MFKIDGFVEDKNVTKVMFALDGLVLDFHCVPVRNAQKKNGKLQSTAANSTLEALTIKAAKLPPKSIVDVPTVQNWLVEGGFAAGSVYGVISEAIDERVLRRTKQRGKYEVLKGADNG
jgi:hypothetical protein